MTFESDVLILTWIAHIIGSRICNRSFIAKTFFGDAGEIEEMSCGLLAICFNSCSMICTKFLGVNVLGLFWILEGSCQGDSDMLPTLVAPSLLLMLSAYIFSTLFSVPI